jgi:hypothetical protein
MRRIGARFQSPLSDQAKTVLLSFAKTKGSRACKARKLCNGLDRAIKGAGPAFVGMTASLLFRICPPRQLGQGHRAATHDALNFPFDEHRIRRDLTRNRFHQSASIAFTRNRQLQRSIAWECA